MLLPIAIAISISSDPVRVFYLILLILVWRFEWWLATSGKTHWTLNLHGDFRASFNLSASGRGTDNLLGDYGTDKTGDDDRAFHFESGWVERDEMFGM